MRKKVNSNEITVKHFGFLKAQLDDLTSKHENILKELDAIKITTENIKQKLEYFDEIQLKNGNGRIIKMLREEFFQMIYDKTQVRYIFNLSKSFMTITLTLLLIINLILTIFPRILGK